LASYQLSAISEIDKLFSLMARIAEVLTLCHAL
jgi:hypothetical protein